MSIFSYNDQNGVESDQEAGSELGANWEVSKRQNSLQKRKPGWLTFTTLWAFSADDKMMLFFLFFPENRIWHFMQIVSLGDNLHEMSNPVFWEK